MNAIDLDDLKAIEKIDEDGMLKAIEDFPLQCQEAVDLARGLSFDIPSDMRSVVVLGMGGSGIGGDIAKVLLEDELRIPFLVNKGYLLPRFVDDRTLCFAVSYSGNTEETLSGFDQAVERGCPVISITTGGLLGNKAEERSLPIVKIPKGLQPRAALGYLSLPILVVLERMALIGDKGQDIQETLAILDERTKNFSPHKPLSQNEAKMLATRLCGKVPVIYGSDGPTAVAALRWKCQFNENSKVPAFWNVFPELNHNETVGWELLRDITTEHFLLLLLRDAEESERVKKRVEITRSLIEGRFGGASEVWSGGKSRLARTFSLIYLGDFVSFYLAALNGVNPSPVERISVLKRRLSEE